jgi:hypothetical protein
MRLPIAIIAALAVAVPAFEPIQPELFGAGANFTNAWADYDNDGDLDLFVGFNGEPNRLYVNTNGTFADRGAVAGVADARATRAAAWGDFDGDGNIDLLVGFAPGTASTLRLYKNSNGSFFDVTSQAGLSVTGGAIRQLVWVDVDGDDDSDLFVAFRDRPNALYLNDRGSFRDVAAARGLADTRHTVGAVWFDFDEDGDLDVIVANMDGDANGLYRNDGGTFVDVALAAGVAWGGRKPSDATNGTVRPCAEDVNGDGRLDLFFANYGTNGLFLNRGDGRFEDVSSRWGIAIDARYDACAFADFDNDGRLDLYVNGTVTGGTSYRDHLFRNNGQSYDDVTPANIQALQADHGVQWADYDRDGAIDLALTGSRADGMHSLLRNRLPDSLAERSLSVLVVDARGYFTRAGAEVRAYARGTRRVLATRLVDAGSGYDAQSAGPVHLGLPGTAPVDVEVTYPGGSSRITARLENVNPVAQRRRNVIIRVARPR